jgi:tetratricopeptide (TPR) repeat protein
MVGEAAPLIQKALSLHRGGAVAEAIRLYSEALAHEPRNADALCYLAMIYCQQGRFPEGIELLQQAIAVAPARASAHNLLGMAQHRTGELSAALASFDAAIACQPDLADAYGNRGSVLNDLDRAPEAIDSYDRALALNPTSLADWCNRGTALHRLGRNEEALVSFDRALALDPTMVEIHANRGNSLAVLERFEEAIAAYDSAIALRPFAQAYAQKGLALKNLDRLDEARSTIERAAAMQPNDPTIAFALAQVLLQQGEWRKAWPHYERRVDMASPAYTPLLSRRWNGELPDQHRLVILTEQGLGDAVQFGRYAALLAARGQAVTVLTHPTLQPLLSSLPGIERVVTTAAELAKDPRPFRWLPLMSLPRALHLMPNSIPAQDPYLSADPGRVSAWADRLGKHGFKIGIAWRTQRRHKAAALAEFAPLAEIDGVRLISLQKQPDGIEIEQAPFRGKIERPTDESDVGADALLDTAAIMRNLDLIVSVDTMVAHLAGALGRPVFVALRWVADWRWLRDRSDSPFYPAMRLFRQSADRGWTNVFADIAVAARQLRNLERAG